eukprot:1543750-Ditylum_brightwellii.AAC.1
MVIEYIISTLSFSLLLRQKAEQTTVLIDRGESKTLQWDYTRAIQEQKKKSSRHSGAEQQDMEHTCRAAFVDSIAKYGGELWAIPCQPPPHGLGQGN